MDGRVQEFVSCYLKNRFSAQFVDTITEPGPNRIIAEQDDFHSIRSIQNRLRISIEKHNSVGIAIVGHEDCAGNPVEKSEQILHLQKSTQWLKKQFAGIEIIALWVELSGKISEI